MKNNWTMEDYQWIQDKNKKTRLWMVVLFLITIEIFIILCKFDFHVYDKQTLIKNNEDFLLIVDSKKINELESESYIYINYKKYQFDITEISTDYTNIDGNIYQTIHINPYNYKTDSIITECYFLKSKKTIWQMIIEFIKGGIG